MRRFSDSEKLTIKSIIELYDRDPSQYLLVNAYNDIFYKYRVEFDASKGSQLFFYRKQKSYSIDDIHAITGYIFETSLLIKYLISCDLIYEIDSNSNNRLNKISGFVKESDDIVIAVTVDKLIYDILFDSLNHSVFISETLRILVEDNFKTTEDKILESNENLNAVTRGLNTNTLEQIGKIDKQIHVTSNLYDQSVIQSNEAKRLADEAQNQTKEAKRQTTAAEQQAKESRKQTWFGFFAVVLSVVAIICSYYVARFVTMEVKVTEEQYSSMTHKLDSLNSITDSILKQSNDTISTFVINMPKEIGPNKKANK